MSEIEFRAWVKENYIERYGWDKRDEELGRMRKVHSIHLNKKKVIISSKYGGNISVPFQYIKLIQYTGLKDKNSVKIFDGDIVKHIKGNVYIVEFYNGGFKLLRFNIYEGKPVAYHDFEVRRLTEIEVIGNIYENKELLKYE
jgi:uncharacterized phage protein (TIGR01671 family)